jgi:hypothetical protein
VKAEEDMSYEKIFFGNFKNHKRELYVFTHIGLINNFLAFVRYIESLRN